ncbi:MAG: hypothetical protein V3V41_07310 [Candidatus Heimdallarchaeota archaeon]
MHGIPKGKRKLINRENIISQSIIFAMIVATVVISFVQNIVLLKIISIIAISIVAVIIISYYTLEFFTGAAYGIASVLNEIIYLALGIPILVISAGFLPVSIFVAFFNPNNRIVNIILITCLVLIEVFAISFIFRRYLRERNMNIIQYLKYLFDFRRRTEEQQKFKQRRDQIDSFYDDLSKVEDRIARKIEERSSGFEEFDWKTKVRQMNGKNIDKIKCWKCQEMNDKDAMFCESCSSFLKKET